MQNNRRNGLQLNHLDDCVLLLYVRFIEFSGCDWRRSDGFDRLFLRQ